MYTGIRVFILCVLCCLTAVSCGDANRAEGVCAVDVDAASDYDLADVALSVDVIPVRSEYPVGEVRRCKGYGDLILVNFDNVLLCVDGRSGDAVRVNRAGRGPGEYTAISDFAYDPDSDMLVISDAQMRQVLVYDLSEMRHIRTLRIEAKIGAVEFLDDGNLLVGVTRFGGDGGGKPSYSVERMDIDTGDMSAALAAGEWKGKDLSSDCLSRGNDGGVYVACEYNPFMFYRVTSDECRSVAMFDMGSHAAPDEAYETLGFFDWEPYIRSYESDAIILSYCHVPCMGCFEGGDAAFWFSNAIGLQKRPPMMAYCRRGGESFVARRIGIGGLVCRVCPAGCGDGFYYAVVPGPADALRDASAELSPLGKDVLEALKGQNDDNPVILKFRMI